MCVCIYIITDFKLYNMAGDCGAVRTVVADAATVDIQSLLIKCLYL